VTVIGAGVIGLSCAVQLAESGLAVDVLARDLPLETTSSVAGGLWLPYLAGPTREVARWGRHTYELLSGLAGVPETGVEVRTGFLLHNNPPPRPSWADAMATMVDLAAVSDPVPGYRFGWRLNAPIVHMPRYLTYLTERLGRAGGTLTRLSLQALPSRGIVVNCTGVASRALAGDPSVMPIRGQILLVSDPGVRHFLSDDDKPDGSATYIIPRGGQVVLGGTADRGEWSTTPDPDVAKQIFARACELLPELEKSTILAHRVGLRPARPEVRLEVEHPRSPRQDGGRHAIVHCYGHGGSGVTLSWGCAVDVTREVLRLLGQNPDDRNPDDRNPDARNPDEGTATR
jgi:D-amino-acid oxidase